MEPYEIISSSLHQLPFKTVQTLIQQSISKLHSGSINSRIVSHDAIHAFNRCGSLFVLFIATASQRVANLDKRKVVNESDVMKALEDCSFYQVIDKLANSGGYVFR
ncbi:CCAAT-binding transcription factor, putative [Babesia microti strain RI]|uniref:CCAAT-binding transcription factor, putative n=1 Tax=Babesia microti (strain RI) TaxID=1133968 RepID=A0A1N6LWA1_BABMR|nr:CCAAT-binding transcription factor, putative [Babesia microti strain RI]SIO73148.1 CCAAT-binding transcription factor, putative [Babesia microti strain RI]|eukprot:XP_021337260.1 CCAAT-binding transcription factor, putative [Babesia microti strain RI]